MEKPIVLYRESIANYIYEGKPAFVMPVNHPSDRVSNTNIVRTSNVISIDGTSFITVNTIYKLQIEIKSTPKTAHQAVQDTIQPNKWVRPVPLTTERIEYYSDAIKHDLTELGYTFKYITCDNCDINSTCTVAFDLYNTDGDCLLK